jgi:multidrug efflux pump subunit AcrA (membrane-fusion protein)
MPKGTLHGWCKIHGVAECLFEHLELAQLKNGATLTSDDLERAGRALETKDRPKNDPSCKLHLRRIQFASREAADKAGIDIGLADRGRIVESVPANGEIRYDPTLVARLASRAAGTVWRVEKNVGDPVSQGELLALVDAVAVGQAKAELLQAAAQLNLHDQTVQRLSSLGDVVAGSRLLEAKAARDEAEAAVRKAIQILANLGLPISLDEVRGTPGSEIASRLHTLGLPPAETQELDRHRTTANLIPILSPRDGVVVARDVVAGEVIDTTRMLFTIVDHRHMWLLLDVPLEDAQYIKVGQRVFFRPDGGTNEHSGVISWISSHIDGVTRTVKVRAELPNPDGNLRDESFGAGRIVIRDEAGAIVAPNEAIHWEGCCYVAFVRDRNYLAKDSYKVFHTRMVRPGVTNGNYTEVIAGLLPGEVLVTKGSGVLRAELLKGNLGAG